VVICHLSYVDVVGLLKDLCVLYLTELLELRILEINFAYDFDDWDCCLVDIIDRLDPVVLNLTM